MNTAEQNKHMKKRKASFWHCLENLRMTHGELVFKRGHNYLQVSGTKNTIILINAEGRTHQISKTGKWFQHFIKQVTTKNVAKRKSR